MRNLHLLLYYIYPFKWSRYHPMVQKFYCERYLSIQSMLGKKEKKNTNISIFSTTPTYLKQTFVCFFLSMNLSLSAHTEIPYRWLLNCDTKSFQLKYVTIHTSRYSLLLLSISHQVDKICSFWTFLWRSVGNPTVPIGNLTGPVGNPTEPTRLS